jgi:hypothetical protein
VLLTKSDIRNSFELEKSAKKNLNLYKPRLWKLDKINAIQMIWKNSDCSMLFEIYLRILKEVSNGETFILSREETAKFCIEYFLLG